MIIYHAIRQFLSLHFVLPPVIVFEISQVGVAACLKV